MATGNLAGATGTAINPWDQMPGEPDRWYGRFQLYLNLGPTRSVTQVYCQFRNLAHTHSTGDWSVKAVQWHWRERAHAWDAYQRSLLALSERNLRIGLRESRIGVTEETLELIRAALERAEIADADREQARAWLPHLWRSLRDMLVVQRQEFEHDFTRDDPAEATPITADDLRAAQRALEALEGAGGRAMSDDLPACSAVEMLRQTPCSRALAHKRTYARERTFLVCPGADSELVLGIAALRAVQAATGLRFTRLFKATRRRLSKTLTRQRGLGYPIEYIHMALHATAEGLELADGAVGWEWLNERLEGVRVLLLANCASTSIGDQLGGVPHVVTLGEKLAVADADLFCRQFWQGIGSGQEPEEALEGALGECAAGMREMVRWYW